MSATLQYDVRPVPYQFVEFTSLFFSVVPRPWAGDDRAAAVPPCRASGGNSVGAVRCAPARNWLWNRAGPEGRGGEGGPCPGLVPAGRPPWPALDQLASPQAGAESPQRRHFQVHFHLARKHLPPNGNGARNEGHSGASGRELGRPVSPPLGAIGPNRRPMTRRHD